MSILIPLFTPSLSSYPFVILLCPNVGVCSYSTCLCPPCLLALFHLCLPVLFLCLICLVLIFFILPSYYSFSFSSSLSHLCWLKLPALLLLCIVLSFVAFDWSSTSSPCERFRNVLLTHPCVHAPLT